VVSFGDASDESHGPIGAPRLVVFGDGDEVRARTGERSARFLLLSGRPLGEPIARHGPFVMNTPEEIEETLRELRDGRFIRR
jgi:quercetin 2,3-dioxygenase